MTAKARMGRIVDCAELSPGVEIEVRARGVWHFEGRVVEIHPVMALFWAESRTGHRQIIELEEYEVYRLRADA